MRFKSPSVSKKMHLNIRLQWNAGTVCVSECVLKTLACRGLRCLRNVCGNSAEISRRFEQIHFIGSGLRKGCGNSAKSLRKFAEICENVLQ